MQSNRNLLFIIAFFLPYPAFSAIDPYDAINAWVPNDNFPRILNSEDIPNFRPLDPQPFFTPTGDFNNDGLGDLAISGTYTLRDQGKNPFFLLVVTQKKGGVIEKLFFETYPKPVFLHKAGETGPADPGTQAFSITFCANCEDGLDFTWDKKSQTFRRTPWVARIQHESKVVEEPAKQVPEELVDASLRIVGELVDVQEFAGRLKKKGKNLGVRVEYESPEAGTTRVYIFEKRETKELAYDTISVDTVRQKIVKRKSR